MLSISFNHNNFPSIQHEYFAVQLIITHDVTKIINKDSETVSITTTLRNAYICKYASPSDINTDVQKAPPCILTELIVSRISRITIIVGLTKI